MKCAEHLSSRWGRPLYFVYAVLALLLFSFMGTAQAQTVMAIAGASLLVINGIGIFMLRNEISFQLSTDSLSESKIKEENLALSNISLEQI